MPKSFENIKQEIYNLNRELYESFIYSIDNFKILIFPFKGNESRPNSRLYITDDYSISLSKFILQYQTNNIIIHLIEYGNQVIQPHVDKRFTVFANLASIDLHNNGTDNWVYNIDTIVDLANYINKLNKYSAFI